MLDSVLKLPHEFLIANTLFEIGLSAFSASEKAALIRGGLTIFDVPGDGVLRAQVMIGEFPQLSVHDGLALALAEKQPRSVLLSGEDSLRAPAGKYSVELCATIWLLEESHRHRLVSRSLLGTILRTLLEDATVKSSRKELTTSLKKYE